MGRRKERCYSLGLLLETLRRAGLTCNPARKYEAWALLLYATVLYNLPMASFSLPVSGRTLSPPRFQTRKDAGPVAWVSANASRLLHVPGVCVDCGGLISFSCIVHTHIYTHTLTANPRDGEAQCLSPFISAVKCTQKP